MKILNSSKSKRPNMLHLLNLLNFKFSDCYERDFLMHFWKYYSILLLVLLIFKMPGKIDHLF